MIAVGGVAAGQPATPDSIDGVKTVEGSPEKGLRYRLRMSPDATPDNPSRLVIWLHPSGGSMNDEVERLAPRLIACGHALVVPTGKNFTAWRGDDVDRLMNHTLPDVAKTPGIDARRPVLLGFSAGGQLALSMYFKNPSAFGGLVLDAAYPLSGRDGTLSLAAAPQGENAKEVPIFALVGAKDGGSLVWKRAEATWREAGVPLTVEYVEGKGHAWLFGEKQALRLGEWLEKVARGEKPSETYGEPSAAGP